MKDAALYFAISLPGWRWIGSCGSCWKWDAIFNLIWMIIFNVKYFKGNESLSGTRKKKDFLIPFYLININYLALLIIVNKEKEQNCQVISYRFINALESFKLNYS